jgi:hypothetical protein
MGKINKQKKTEKSEAGLIFFISPIDEQSRPRVFISGVVFDIFFHLNYNVDKQLFDIVAGFCRDFDVGHVALC